MKGDEACMRKRIIPFFLAIFIIASVACARESEINKHSPAPGCIEYEGPAPLGGCFGKTAILDLRVDPKINCLTISVNNCNGGVLETANSCSEALILGGVEIVPSEGYVALDIAGKQGGGLHVLKRSSGNISEYVPQQDEKVEISGTLGKRAIKVSFTKTKKLC
jgi:hypothetical protein